MRSAGSGDAGDGDALRVGFPEKRGELAAGLLAHGFHRGARRLRGASAAAVRHVAGREHALLGDATIQVDFAVHRVLPAMIRERFPGLAGRLEDTSPRWGRRARLADARFRA